jgi:hypothetical protein
MKNQQHGTATNGQFVQLTTAMMIALAEVVKVFPIKTLLALFADCDDLTRLLKSVMYAWVNKRPLLILEGKMKFEPFVTVKLGTKNSQDLYNSLKKSRCKFYGYAEEVLQNESGRYQDCDKEGWDLYEISGEVKDLKLIVIRVGDLGFTNYPEQPLFSDICDRAGNLGLGLCPAEVGPTLIDQHPEIAYAKLPYLYVAMKPIKMPNLQWGNFRPGIFRPIDKNTLSIKEAWPRETRFSADDHFIFVKDISKKTS